MPNWCYNELIVEGQEEPIARFKQEVRGRKNALSLGRLYKMPEALKGTVSPGDEPNWYDWCVKHWGTKWDVVEATLAVRSKRALKYLFLSAWTPPIAWLRKVSKEYRGLEFTLTYDEPGAGLLGTARARNGRVTVKEADS